MSETRLGHRVALVTGAARGIGAATAIALARRGISPVLAVRNGDAARDVAEEVRRLGVSCLIAACDVSSYESVRDCVARTLEEFGRLDIVINNAGQVEPQALLAQTDPAAWAQAISVNLVGPYNVIHAAMPELLRRQGVVVNLSTGAAHTPRDGWSAYCSSKAGLHMLSRSVHSEYGKQGISVYSLQPGLVDTEMQKRIRGAGTNEISRIPKEQLAPPEISAGIVAWLAATAPGDLMGMELSVADQSLVERAHQ